MHALQNCQAEVERDSPSDADGEANAMLFCSLADTDRLVHGGQDSWKRFRHDFPRFFRHLFFPAPRAAVSLRALQSQHG